MIAAYAVAIAWAVYEWQRPIEPPGAVTGGAEPGLPELAIENRSLDPPQRYSQLVERPPFMSTRRPPSLEEPEPEQVAVAVPQGPRVDASNLRVTAVVVTGDRRTALVEHDNGSLIPVIEGTRIDNWRVDEIRDDRIQLEDNGRQATLLVHRFDDAPPPMARRPAPPPGVLRIRPRRQQPEPPQPDAAGQVMQQQTSENEEPPR